MTIKLLLDIDQPITIEVIAVTTKELPLVEALAMTIRRFALSSYTGRSAVDVSAMAYDKRDPRSGVLLTVAEFTVDNMTQKYREMLRGYERLSPESRIIFWRNNTDLVTEQLVSAIRKLPR